MSYFVAPDYAGDTTLWRGTGPDDSDCEAVADKRALDRMDPVLWPTLVAALVPARGARRPRVTPAVTR